MIPTLPVFDSAPGLLGDRYRYLSRGAAQLESDAFYTRVGGRRALCIRGAEAAHFFYEGDRFDRMRAMPPTTAGLPRNSKSVRTLDGDEHRMRRFGFLQLLQGSSDDRMEGIARQAFRDAVLRWRAGDVQVMQDELPPIFTSIATRWAGIPEDLVGDDLSGDLWAMIENAGSVGPTHWVAQLRRSRAEEWARKLIRGVRRSTVDAVEGTPLAALAQWTDSDGDLLPVGVAAVELLNLLRPTVAVALFAEFAMLALALKPHYRDRFAEGDLTDLDAFVHEVRRRTPFLPLSAGRAASDLDWRGETVPEGTWTLLDLFGTNHDPRLWPRPHQFDPARYRRGDGDARHIVAQGSGHYASEHRRPGEPTMEVLLREAIRAFSAPPWGLVPRQNLRVTWGSVPARVRGGVAVVFR